MRRISGFTLAEVLITLGIIGVVAALTIPTLISNTTGAQFKTAYKKALSTLNQAIVMNVAIDDFDFSSMSVYTATDKKTMKDILGQRLQVSGELSGYTAPANLGDLKYSINGGTEQTATSAKPTGTIKVVGLADGTAFGYGAEDEKCTKEKPCVGFIDANGITPPNAVTTDATDPKDIYPVVYYGQTVIPANDAARDILFGNDKATAATTSTK